MSTKPNSMDVTPTQRSPKLLFCSNCGEKQTKYRQMYCANCGDPFYKDSPNTLSMDTDEDTVSEKRLDSIGGWLILPYIGFYATVLVGLVYMALLPSINQDSTAKKVFLELLFACMIATAVICIVFIHRRSKALITSVTILYVLGFILAVDSSIKAHNPVSAIGDAVVAGLWITYFHNSKRVSALVSKKSKKRRTQESSHTVLAVTLSVVAVVVIGLLVGIVAYANHSDKADVSKLNSLGSELQTDYNQYASLPSSTTKLKAGWDSYYSNYSSEIQAINTATKTTYSSSKLNSYNSDVQKTSSDFLNLISIDQSSTDMSFQVQSDQSSISGDNNIITEYTDDDITDGEALMAGEISAEQSTLSNDKTTLQNDQQTYKNQQSQAFTEGTTVLADLAQLSRDSKANTN